MGIKIKIWERSTLFCKARFNTRVCCLNILRVRRGFTLWEVMVVLAIMAIGMGIFYTTLMINWTSFEKNLSYMELQLDADIVLEMMSADVRYAKGFVVGITQKDMTLTFPDNSTAIYQLLPDGRIEKQRGAASTTISAYLKYNESFIRRDGNNIEYDFVFHDFIFGQEVQLRDGSQVYPRNLQ